MVVVVEVVGVDVVLRCMRFWILLLQLMMNERTLSFEWIMILGLLDPGAHRSSKSSFKT